MHGKRILAAAAALTLMANAALAQDDPDACQRCANDQSFAFADTHDDWWIGIGAKFSDGTLPGYHSEGELACIDAHNGYDASPTSRFDDEEVRAKVLTAAAQGREGDAFLLKLLVEDDGAVLNVRRSALQVVSSSGSVSLHVPLSVERVAHLDVSLQLAELGAANGDLEVGAPDTPSLLNDGVLRRPEDEN